MRSNAVVAAPRKAQNAVCKDRIDDQPNCGCRDHAVCDDRAHAPVTHENRGNEIEIKDPVQSPIYRAEQDEDIRNQIRNDHMRYLLSLVCPEMRPFIMEISGTEIQNFINYA